MATKLLTYVLTVPVSEMARRRSHSRQRPAIVPNHLHHAISQADDVRLRGQTIAFFFAVLACATQQRTVGATEDVVRV